MADSVSISLPNILWRIESYSTLGKKVCTLSFLGLEWKLICNVFMDVKTRTMKLRLKCSNVPKSLQTLKLSSDTCLIRNVVSNGQYIPLQSEKTLTNEEEWCLWSSSIASITKSFGQVPDICFSVKIFPTDVEKEKILLIENIIQSGKQENVLCTTSLHKDIANLYNNNQHSDFELRCKEWRLPVHKAVLSTRCSYFAALFRSDMKEADKGYVEFCDIEPDILQHVIHYLYTGTLPELATDIVREVFAVADRFDFESLMVKCSSLMMDSFERGHQNKTENDTSNKKEDNVHDSYEDKTETLLKKLFSSSQWRALFEECPAVAIKMCKPIFLEKPKI